MSIIDHGNENSTSSEISRLRENQTKSKHLSSKFNIQPVSRRRRRWTARTRRGTGHNSSVSIPQTLVRLWLGESGVLKSPPDLTRFRELREHASSSVMKDASRSLAENRSFAWLRPTRIGWLLLVSDLRVILALAMAPFSPAIKQWNL